MIERGARVRSIVWNVGLSLALAACAEPRPVGPALSASTAAVASASAPPLGPSASASAASPPANAAPGWIEAVSLERWTDAAKLIDALSEGERARPEVRYARGRAALGMGDGAAAIALFDGLERSLPLLAGDLARRRAEAQLIAGPFKEAAAFFGASAAARDQVRAAIAFERASDLASARRAIDRAVTVAGKAKSVRDEAAARLVRHKIRAAAKDPRADDDLHWILKRAPASVEAKPARELLTKAKPASFGPPKPASPEPATPIGPPKPAKVEHPGVSAHDHAMALYKARSWAAASKAFLAAAAGKGPREAEDLHYAGKSLEREGRDEDAIASYRAVTDKHKRSPFAERSAYALAALLLRTGRAEAAVEAHARYLAAFPRGEHREAVRLGHALALVSTKDGAAKARALFGELARREGGDTAAKMRELEGVAALRAGDKDGAVVIFSEVARLSPLTWASAAARARLASLGAPLPPLISPSITGLDREPLRITRAALPPAASLLASVGLDGDAERHLLASEQQAGAAYPGREGEALCGLYGLLSRGKRRYRVGIQAVESNMLYHAPAPSEAWAWDCVYPRPFAPGVRALESEHGLPAGVLWALMRQESAFDPEIVSPAGAVGLMQLMPTTAEKAAAELAMPYDGAELVHPDTNLRLGAHYFAKLYAMFQKSVVLAAAGYNAGPKAVSHWLVPGADNELDVWVARIPYDETRGYVAKVVQNLTRYQYQQGGEAVVMSFPLALPESRAPEDAY